MKTNCVKAINVMCLASPGIHILGDNHCVVNGDHSQTHQTHQNSHDPSCTPDYVLCSHPLRDSGTHMLSGICLDPHLTYQQ
jgi:hypothetical protein